MSTMVLLAQIFMSFVLGRGDVFCLSKPAAEAFIARWPAEMPNGCFVQAGPAVSVIVVDSGYRRERTINGVTMRFRIYLSVSPRAFIPVSKRLPGTSL